MRHTRLCWTLGCWISLFLLSVYHNIFHYQESAFPVWYATFVVWVVGLVALSSLKKMVADR